MFSPRTRRVAAYIGLVVFGTIGLLRVESVASDAHDAAEKADESRKQLEEVVKEIDANRVKAEFDACVGQQKNRDAIIGIIQLATAPIVSEPANAAEAERFARANEMRASFRLQVETQLPPVVCTPPPQRVTKG